MAITLHAFRKFAYVASSGPRLDFLFFNGGCPSSDMVKFKERLPLVDTAPYPLFPTLAIGTTGTQSCRQRLLCNIVRSDVYLAAVRSLGVMVRVRITVRALGRK